MMIHLFCALPCEATPVIEAYQLREEKNAGLFRLFLSADKKISLCITGVGKRNAATAVAFHHGYLQTRPEDVWLNTGVAGHKEYAIGDACLAHKIIDMQSGETWFPQILFSAPCKSESLITLEAPSNHYQNCLFDMEAAGFYSTAIRLGIAEHIHALKIISDNEASPLLAPDKKRIHKLIKNNMGIMNEVINSLVESSGEMQSLNKAPEHYVAFIEHWHFTETQKHTLQQILRHWTIRLPGTIPLDAVAHLTSGKAILKHLTQTLNESAFSFND